MTLIRFVSKIVNRHTLLTLLMLTGIEIALLVTIYRSIIKSQTLAFIACTVVWQACICTVAWVTRHQRRIAAEVLVCTMQAGYFGAIYLGVIIRHWSRYLEVVTGVATILLFGLALTTQDRSRKQRPKEQLADVIPLNPNARRDLKRSRRL